MRNKLYSTDMDIGEALYFIDKLVLELARAGAAGGIDE
jgi:hypothetical protein